MSSKAIDMTGVRYGSITAISAAGPSNGAKIKWLCRCDCGCDFVTCGGKIRSGEVISCPSCSRERVRLDRVTHGKRKTDEYRIWTHIKSRCFNPKVPSYKNYGGRGITMCDKWRESFDSFISDMGCRPSTDHSIDRINNDGNYEPGNCRWATRKTQMNNTRVNRLIQIEGETKTMTQWADVIGVCREVVYKRLKRGIAGAELLDQIHEVDLFTLDGVSASIKEWSLITGIKRATLYWRINSQKWPLSRALTEGVRS